MISESIALKENQLQRIFQTIEKYAITILTPEGIFTTWNAGGEQLTGYTAEEIIGKHFSIFYPSNNQGEPARALATAKSTGRWQTTGLRVRKDKQTYWADVSVEKLTDETGQLTGFIAIVQDITERIDLEHKRKAVEIHLNHIINTVADPIFVKDRQHNWVLLNDACCAFMGRTREELTGKSDYDFFPKVEADVFWEKDEHVFATGEENVNEESFTGADGVPHTIVTKKTLFLDAERNPFLVGVIRDITIQKKAETDLRSLNVSLEQRIAERTKAIEEQSQDLARSNAELERFAYVASHDLQEPLRMITSYLQLISRRYKGKLGQDADEFIGFAVDGATRMKTLIRDLLEFSRLGRKAKDLKPTNASQVLDEVLGTLKIAAQECDAVITWTSLPLVMSDAVQLAQVFQNLIGNALKFKSDQEPRIHIAAQAKDNQWVFSICDNGIGFDAGHKDRVFEVFQRLHTADKYPGTGIGLAICKKIIERQGGHIWVESAPGKGSTFFFTLNAASQVRP